MKISRLQYYKIPIIIKTADTISPPMKLIKAIRKEDDFLADLDFQLQDQENFYMWWLGQSGFLLQWRGQRVLMDPYLSDSLTIKYAGTSKPHIRMCEKVVDPAKLTGITLVTSSHNHTDHLDGETLIPLLAINPEIQMVIPEANRVFVTDRIKKNLYYPIGLSEGRSVTIGHFTLHGIPAAHNEIERDEYGNDRFMGYVISFGKWSIYHSGDTLLYEGMADSIKPYNVDLAIIPINGNDPSRGVAGNLSASEAVQLAGDIGAKWLIPCHYDMFTFNTVDVNEFARIAGNRAQPHCILDIGGKICSRELEPVLFQE
jgi:L-ascorbate metabolism protein UlaG (beta-lactamase superfamily)